MSKEQLSSLLVWHPALTGVEEVVAPDVGSFIWFAAEQKPRLGKVESVDMSAARQITVSIFEPQGRHEELVRIVLSPPWM